MVTKDRPLPKPSEDGRKLLQQIARTGEGLQPGGRLLEFLTMAKGSPAFSIEHVLYAVRRLGKQAQGRAAGDKIKEEVQGKYADLVEEIAKRAVDDLNVEDCSELRANSVYETISAIAALKDGIPQFLPLVPPLSEIAGRGMEDVDARKVVLVLTAVTELRPHFPELVDTLLPRIVRHRRWLGMRQYLLDVHKQEHSQAMKALNTLKREVPYLRTVIKT